MKKLLYIFIILLTLSSCRKSGVHNDPYTNIFNLSFNGKTYNASNNFTVTSSGKIGSITPIGYGIEAAIQPFYSPPHTLLCGITCDIAGHFQINFEALSATDSTHTGKYTVLNSYYLIDSTSGNTVYTIGSTSNLTLTEADSIWIAGTMNFDITDNSGNHFPGTGSFKISARQ